jgi:hypothetical protein
MTPDALQQVSVLLSNMAGWQHSTNCQLSLASPLWRVHVDGCRYQPILGMVDIWFLRC